jgi:hypothetical protein
MLKIAIALVKIMMLLVVGEKPALQTMTIPMEMLILEKVLLKMNSKMLYVLKNTH